MDETTRMLRTLTPKNISGPKMELVIPNHSGDHSAGNVFTTPTHDEDIVNKGYVDSKGEFDGPVTITADNSTADLAYVPMVLYNTDATPPAANTVPIGTIYIQYTP